MDTGLWVLQIITIVGTVSEIQTTPMQELTCKRLAYDLVQVKAPDTKQIRDIKCYGPGGEKWTPTYSDGTMQREVRPK